MAASRMKLNSPLDLTYLNIKCNSKHEKKTEKKIPRTIPEFTDTEKIYYSQLGKNIPTLLYRRTELPGQISGGGIARVEAREFERSASPFKGLIFPSTNYCVRPVPQLTFLKVCTTDNSNSKVRIKNLCTEDKLIAEHGESYNLSPLRPLTLHPHNIKLYMAEFIGLRVKAQFDSESVIFAHNFYEDLICPPLVVFLTLGWHGTTQGDLIITLENSSVRSRQFLSLCIGESEHSYRGTSFLTISNFGNPGEMVTGGDYDKNDGTGGQSILPGIPENENTVQPVIEGLLSGGPAKCNGAQFNIYTQNLPGAFDYWSFGRVTAGMDILKKAVLLSNIQDVKIENCGAVL
ncbi:uncharacterized protein LOC134763112 [Penaeus indicus]|uniref:uncharacterized protein LOC134763112 n=1 Tax=Penaeus indicus TaxID=29960 RepID=UPI00300D07EB